MGDLIGQLLGWATEIINTLGYFGVGFLIALETLFPPIPSEVVLPLSGNLAANGKFNLLLTIASATLGSVVGASILYSVGKGMGEERLGEWLDRHGKWLLLSRSDLEHSQRWFERHGSWSVLIGRLIPGVRSLISVPAGVVEMALWKFIVFTAIGSGLWNSVLILAGYFLGQNWKQVEGFLSPISSVAYALIVLATAFFVGKRLARMLRQGRVEGGERIKMMG